MTSTLQSYLLTYLVNSLWQVPLLFCAAALAARMLRGQPSRDQYRLWVLTLLAEIGVPAISTRAGISRLFAFFLPAHSAPQSTGISVSFGPATALTYLHLPALLLRCAAVGYVAVLGCALVRLTSSLVRTMSLTKAATPARLDPQQELLWQRCLAHFALPAPRLLETAAVQVPSTLGFFRPVLLLPEGLLERIPATDLATLLAHECAHVQRGDFFWNLILQCAALPLAFHPLQRRSWGRLVETREWVCDELAAEFTGPPFVYARSLLRLATQLLPAPPRPSTHAIGMLDSNALKRRIMHLTRSKGGNVLSRTATLALCGLLGIAACGTAWAWRLGVPVAAPIQSEDGPTPFKVPSSVMAGSILTRVNPVYPPEAKAKGLEGKVVLSATISKEGVVEKLTPLSGPDELIPPSLDAVRQWTYTPYRLNGEPTEVTTTITINYNLHP